MDINQNRSPWTTRPYQQDVAPRDIQNNPDESVLTPMITPDSKHKFKLFNLEEEMNKNA